MNNIKIDTFEIGKDSPPFIVAEAGINHNGELEKAYEMICTAKQCGVDAIKFQTFKAGEFIADSKQMFTYQSQGKEVTESMLTMFQRYEFSCDEWFLIKKKCDEQGILFLSTPQNKSDLEILLELNITAIKVGSDDLTNLPLLKDYANTGLPMVISCGMSDLAEVYQALDVIGSLDGYPTILLLCTSQYPTPAEDVNLLKFKTLSSAFPQIVMGFSDHTQGSLASSLAVAFGAKFFEKHFTLDHQLSGPDHWFSEDPEGLKHWVDTIRQAWLMMGSNIVRPTALEIQNKHEFQRVIVASSPIKKGDKLTVENLTMRRISGGKGLSASLYNIVLGKIANRKFYKYEAIEL